MKVVVIGSGAREHALVHKIKESPQCKEIYAIPGNAGIEAMGVSCISDIQISDFESIKAFCREKDIDFVMVGPELPLVQGIADAFEGEKAFVIGPKSKAAQLEASKSFAKHFLKKYHIPTADHRTFTKENMQEAIDYVHKHPFPLPLVIKADGLAAGKGVFIAHTYLQAKKAILKMMEENQFGSAGHTIVIEEFMKGEEMSLFVLCDGEHYIILPEAKDYKRIGEQDTGYNTGGMGAFSPVPFIDEDFMQKVEEKIVKRTIEGLLQENIPYTGILFIGLMNVNKNPRVVEFNCRLGDPETQVILQRIDIDWISVFQHLKNKTLHQCNLKVKNEHALCIVLASEGYPIDFETGKIITNYDSTPDYTVYHAGTKSENGHLLTAGGRVFSIVAKGNTLAEAREKASQGAKNILYENKYYRKDIGLDFIE